MTWNLRSIASAQGAKACGFENYGLHESARGDLVLTTAQAVVEQPRRKLVVARGKVVARND
jgi:cytosine deaminase